MAMPQRGGNVHGWITGPILASGAGLPVRTPVSSKPPTSGTHALTQASKQPNIADLAHVWDWDIKLAVSALSSGACSTKA